MTIETEVANLTTATTTLLGAVNVAKVTLDAAVDDATAQADLATSNGAAQVVLATAQASNAGISAAEATAQASIATASAANASNAVIAQLGDIKSQTEYVRDQAIAGLGAADNSQALSELLGAIGYATDLSGMASRTIRGGTVTLAAGAAATPSLTSSTDADTGVYFPAPDVVAVSSAGLERARITADGRLGIGTTTPSGLLDVADNKLRIRTAQTPASATAPGNAGEVCWDASYLYVCTATNSWKRVAIAAW